MLNNGDVLGSATLLEKSIDGSIRKRDDTSTKIISAIWVSFITDMIVRQIITFLVQITKNLHLHQISIWNSLPTHTITNGYCQRERVTTLRIYQYK